MKLTDIPFLITHYTPATDRRAYLEQAFKAFGVTPIWITEGDREELTEEVTAQYYEFDPVAWSKKAWFAPKDPKRLTPSQISNNVKHVIARRKVLCEGWDFASILEDDVIFCDGFERLFPIFMEKLLVASPRWDRASFGTGNRGYVDANITDVKCVLADCGVPVSCSDSLVVSRWAVKEMVKTDVPFHLPCDLELE